MSQIRRGTSALHIDSWFDSLKKYLGTGMMLQVPLGQAIEQTS